MEGNPLLMIKVQASEADRQEQKPWSSLPSILVAFPQASSAWTPLSALSPGSVNKTIPTLLHPRILQGPSKTQAMSWLCRHCQALPHPVLFDPASLNVKGKKKTKTILS